MKTKTFDCVAMKHRGAQRINKKIAGMTLEQQLDFWRERTQVLRERQLATLKKHLRKSGVSSQKHKDCNQ